mgnify:CR=1 FL=1
MFVLSSVGASETFRQDRRPATIRRVPTEDDDTEAGEDGRVADRAENRPNLDGRGERRVEQRRRRVVSREVLGPARKIRRQRVLEQEHVDERHEEHHVHASKFVEQQPDDDAHDAVGESEQHRHRRERPELSRLEHANGDADGDRAHHGGANPERRNSRHDEFERTTQDWLDSGGEMRWTMAGVDATKEALREAGFTVTGEWTPPEQTDDGGSEPPFLAARLDTEEP